MSEFRAFVDRLEGDKAVLLIGENEETSIVIPSSFLPDDARPGAVLTISVRYEPKITEDSRSSVADMIKRLTDRK